MCKLAYSKGFINFVLCCRLFSVSNQVAFLCGAFHLTVLDLAEKSLAVIEMFPIASLFHRWLEGAVVSSGDPVKGLRDGGGGEGEESHDLCAPAGGSLQHSTGLPAPAEARHSLQSGSRWLHWHNKQLFRSPPEHGASFHLNLIWKIFAFCRYFLFSWMNHKSAAHSLLYAIAAWAVKDFVI